MGSRYFPKIRGLNLTVLARSWGLSRVRFEKIPVLGDWLLRGRLSRLMYAQLGKARFLGAGKARAS